MTARHYDAVVADHTAPIPAEPSDHHDDPTLAWWKNDARAVWEGRNPGKRWEEFARYPVLSSNRLAGWFSLRGQTALLAAVFADKGRKTRVRGTHACGVAARGTLRIADRLELPEHPFFTPGRSFRCRVRHANGSFFDDAACSVRGAAIKFADSEFESPLDLMLNCGSQGPLWSTASFLYYGRYRSKCDATTGDFAAQARLMDETPAYLVSWNEGVRLGPQCYSDITYYSCMVFPFVGRDGVLRYLRYRLRRPDLERESGMLSAERQRTAWNMRRDAGDDRPLDHTRAEFLRRMKTGGVRYVLQVQLRDPDPNDTTEVFHLNRPWDTGKWPWRELATISLDEAIAQQDTEHMRYSIAHQPEGLGVFNAPSAGDYRSIGWSRSTLYWASQWGRGRGPKAPPTDPYI